MRRLSKDSCLATVNPKLAKEWHPTKNGVLTPEDVTPNSNKKVWWQCKNGHEWESTVSHRSRGQGCPYCSGRNATKENCLASVKEMLAKEWHPTKNGNLTPYDVTSGSGKKVWWLCKNGHEWKAFINNRSKGIGCPYCANKEACDDNCLATIKPQLAKEWHPTKNGNLTPQDVLPNSNKKVWWRCKHGHEWQTTVANRNKAKGCPFCANQRVCNDNCLATINPQLAKEWHLTKNEKLTPYDVTTGTGKKVWWQCSKGHEWKATISSRNAGSGCPYCANKKTNSDNCLAIINPNVAREWHPTKNGTLTSFNVTPGSNKKVWWKCNRGHEWQTTVSSRSAGTGCPKCSSATSQLELRVFSELKYLFSEVEHRKKMFKVECDIYVPEIKCAIEIDGAYWHKNKTRKDEEKNKVLEERGIFLLRVRGCGLNKIAKHDILLPKRFRSVEVIKNILSVIKDNQRLERDSENKINKYIKEGKLKNEEEYKEILYMLPGPLPGKSLANINPDIAKQWHPTKNGSLTSKDVSSNSNKKVWWLCSKGHEWKAVVGSRNKGIGCPYCSNQKVDKDNCLATINPKLAKEWHPTKNSNSTPYDVTPGAGKKAWWKCNEGHEWKAVIRNRAIRGDKCPYCSGRNITKDNCLATINPKLAKEWHPTKNGTLTTQNVLPNSNKKVWWLCNKGHEWQAIINDRRKCPYCSNRKVCNDNCLAAINPKLAREWHPTKNGKLTPENVLPKSTQKAWWLCKHGHEWQATIYSRDKGTGCPCCAGQKAYDENCLATLNPKLAKEWHPTKNRKLTPRDVMPGSGKKVWWLCNKGHEWQAIIKNRSKAKGIGCPECQKIIKFHGQLDLF